jgi:hypothetical protein
MVWRGWRRLRDLQEDIIVEDQAISFLWIGRSSPWSIIFLTSYFRIFGHFETVDIVLVDWVGASVTSYRSTTIYGNSGASSRFFKRWECFDWWPWKLYIYI